MATVKKESSFLNEDEEQVKKVEVEQVYFIHMGHHLCLHDEVNAQLPEHVKLSYDGLVLEW
jgi:phosphoribosyl 1,2-cyclic phosphate phosphodiesterase